MDFCMKTDFLRISNCQGVLALRRFQKRELSCTLGLHCLQKWEKLSSVFTLFTEERKVEPWVYTVHRKTSCSPALHCLQKRDKLHSWFTLFTEERQVELALSFVTPTVQSRSQVVRSSGWWISLMSSWSLGDGEIPDMILCFQCFD